MSKTIFKRLYAVMCTLCLAVAMVVGTFTQKTLQSNVVACAETSSEEVFPDAPKPHYDGFYTVPLSTYNNITVYESMAFSPVPLALAFNKDTVSVYMTDGYVNPLLLTVPLSTIFTKDILTYPSGYAYNVSVPVNIANGNYWEDWQWFNACKMSFYTGSFTFKNYTEEEYRKYLPYKVTQHYIVQCYNDVPYMCLDYYVDYVHYSKLMFAAEQDVANADLVRGLGFSLRLPLDRVNTDGTTTFKSLYYTCFNAVPTTRYNAYVDYGLYAISYSMNYQQETISYLYGFLDGYEYGIKDKDVYWYNKGYDVGYIAGASNGQNYTFKGFLTSIIDVPINALRSVLNFNLLGIDMATFAFSLLTLAVIVTVVRLLL